MDEIYSKIKYLDFLKLNRSNWNISWNLCNFLSNFIKLSQPKLILEIGTSNGFSALCLMRYLNKDSKIISIEINEMRYREAKNNLNSLNKNNQVILLNENILDLLNINELVSKNIQNENDEIDLSNNFNNLNEYFLSKINLNMEIKSSTNKKIIFDLIFLDAAQSYYLEIISKLIEGNFIAKDTIVICDNILSHKNMGDFLDYMKNNFKCDILDLDSGFLIAKKN